MTAELVRARVTRLLPIASVGLAPRDATLVNIQTVMWVDAPGLKDLPGVRILGQRVLIRLSDPSVRYDFGDGSVLDAQSAGKAYSESDPCRTRLCPDYYGHIYRASGHRTVTAAVHWHVSFTVDGGGRVRVPGTVDGPAASAPIVVREARSVLVRNP